MRAPVVGDVSEPEGVASLVFGEPVVALGSGVGVAGGDCGFDDGHPAWMVVGKRCISGEELAAAWS
jgi:hypothetical protein